MYLHMFGILYTQKVYTYTHIYMHLIASRVSFLRMLYACLMFIALSVFTNGASMAEVRSSISLFSTNWVKTLYTLVNCEDTAMVTTPTTEQFWAVSWLEPSATIVTTSSKWFRMRGTFHRGLNRGDPHGGNARKILCFYVFWTLVAYFSLSCEHHRGKWNLRYSLDETDASGHRGDFSEATLNGKSICWTLFFGFLARAWAWHLLFSRPNSGSIGPSIYLLTDLTPDLWVPASIL